jgi:hypothetical protein
MILFILIISLLKNSNSTFDGLQLKEFIDCYSDYLENASLRPDNSYTLHCNLSEIIYCKTDKGYDDIFCQFDGTNFLKQNESANPECYYNCQMETCDAWDIPHSEHQDLCIQNLILL